jgi:hypothetical protein
MMLNKVNLDGTRNLELIQNDQVIITGHPADVKKKYKI